MDNDVDIKNATAQVDNSTNKNQSQYPSTPLQSKPPIINTNTITIPQRKTRNRQQTVTVESQVSKEVNEVFSDIENMADLDNPMEELRRRMQRLFCEKDNMYHAKIDEVERNFEEDLALTKVKLNIALRTLADTAKFFKIYQSAKPNNETTAGVTTPSGRNALSPMSASPSMQHQSANDSDRTITSDAYADAIKERNILRDELRELENSYSDLFKRYEKMRENCVLLKNTEESLKKNIEDEAARYEKLAGIYGELRLTAANELNKANEEVVRLIAQHDENTLNLRCRLKRCETEINSMKLTIQGKDSEIEQLKELNDELMRKAAVDYEDGAASITDSYEEY